MGIADWIFIDGTMDNAIQSYRDECWDPDSGAEARAADARASALADLGESVSQAGRDQITEWPSGIGSAWELPEPGEPHKVTLNVAQWALVVSELEDSAVVDDQIGEPADAARVRRIAARIRQQLAKQGLVSVPSVRPNDQGR
ncbi:hypothetical protein [Actinoplanes sp. NPDC049599]|uniref:hypothetical protein n=1 Tax=Actinoplanes sp. NPDC049599 TaxID=3363903 RepID=UPI003791DD69